MLFILSLLAFVNVSHAKDYDNKYKVNKLEVESFIKETVLKNKVCKSKTECLENIAQTTKDLLVAFKQAEIKTKSIEK